LHGLTVSDALVPIEEALMANRRVSDPQQPSRSASPVPATATPVEVAPAAKARKRRVAGKAQAVIAANPAPQVTEDERRGMIALSAYLRGERRGFAPGGEAEDWLAAEKEIDALLSNSGAAQ
jgi:hypothetical protein